MYTCPHCSAPTISGWRKLNATSSHPARCPGCGGLSFVSGWSHHIGTLFGEVAFWGSIILALVLRSWYALLLLPLSIVAVIALLNSGFQLRATDASGVATARTRWLVELAVITAIVAACYLLFGNK
jgi:hypothetical protein